MDSSKHGLIIDLNKYRPKRDLKQYLDAGVDGFILRIGGPAQWVEGNFRYTEDPTWRPYMDQAAKLGITHQIGGYIIHNPFEPVNVAVNEHIDRLNQWTSGGYMPGYFILDHEVNYCYRGATKITATVPNQVKSLGVVTDAMYKKWGKMVAVYSGRWYLDQNGLAEHAVYFDNINQRERQRPTWYAWYLNLFEQEFPDLKQAVEALPTPTGAQIGKYLQCGSYSLANLWQFTDRLKITGDTYGVDASVTMGTLAEYWAAVGVKASPKPPVEPPIEPPVTPDLTAILARLAALEARLAQQEQHTHTATIH
jgi:hypothetical protein